MGKKSADQGKEVGRGHVGVLNGAIRIDLTEKMTSDQTDASGKADFLQREELGPGGQWGRSKKRPQARSKSEGTLVAAIRTLAVFCVR